MAYFKTFCLKNDTETVNALTNNSQMNLKCPRGSKSIWDSLPLAAIKPHDEFVSLDVSAASHFFVSWLKVETFEWQYFLTWLSQWIVHLRWYLLICLVRGRSGTYTIQTHHLSTLVWPPCLGLLNQNVCDMVSSHTAHSCSRGICLRSSRLLCTWHWGRKAALGWLV